MDNTTAAQGFSALGSEARIAVYRTLVRAGEAGLPVGEIQKRTDIPASTLAHHIKFLSSADLILQEKQGRSIICRANYDHLQLLASFILEECCAEPESTS